MAELVWFFPHLPKKLPYRGVKQHTDSKYEVPIYDDWFEALNSLPMGASNVATTVPSRILNCLNKNKLIYTDHRMRPGALQTRALPISSRYPILKTC